MDDMAGAQGKLPRKIYYLSSTHWDREWYKPFQGFRKKLVDNIDGIMDDLDDHPGITQFVLDGQTAVLDDYTEIRPECRDRLTRYIKEGRMKVGPWYTMPDEFLVSGESLVHNLSLGQRKSLEYGAEAMKFGYGTFFALVPELQGESTYEYRFMPIHAEDSNGEIWRNRDALAAGVKAFVDYGGNTERTGVSIQSDNIVLSCCEPCEGGILIRVFNTAGTAATAEIRLPVHALSIVETDLLGNSKAIRPTGDRFGIELSAAKIATYHIGLPPFVNERTAEG